jgi:hypothetical protein
VFAKKDGIWAFRQVQSLNIGDSILNEDCDIIDITSIDIINSVVQTVNIDTELTDVYFVRGMLAHNFYMPK